MLKRQRSAILTNAFWLFLISTLIGLIFFYQGWIMASPEMPFKISEQLYWAMAGWYMWALLFPGIHAFTKKFPIERSVWKSRVAIHFLAALILSFLHVYIQMRITNWMPFLAKKPNYMVDGYVVGMVMWRMVVYASLVSVSLAVEYYRKYREGKVLASSVEARILRAQMEALKMQMDPDFLFETLHSVKDLMYRDVIAADKMIARLGDFLRLTLDTSGSSQVPVRKELEFVKCYLEIQKIRLKNTLQIEFEIPPETLDARIPNLLLYSLVDEAVERRKTEEQLRTPMKVRADRSDESFRLQMLDSLALRVESEPVHNNLHARMKDMYGTSFRLFTDILKDGSRKTTVEIPWADTQPETPPESDWIATTGPEEEQGVELEWVRRSEQLESADKPTTRWRPYLWSTLAFTLLGLFFFLRESLTMLFNNKAINWMDQIRWFGIWYIWAMMAPYVAFFSRKFPLERPHLVRNALLHVVNSIVVLAVMSWASITYGWLLDPKMPYVAHLAKEFKIPGFAVDNVLYWMIVAVCSAGAYYREFRRGEFKYARLRAQLARAQLQALKMQLHPHFLFNTLNSISELIQEEMETAEKMLMHLERFLRLTVQNSEAQEVPFETELEFLKCYLEIEHVRFQDRLSVRMDIQPQAMNVPVPNLLLQPIVENAIRHGIAPRSSAGHIDIRAVRANGRLKVSIQDDGPGMDQDSPTNRKGLGLSNTRERLQQLYGQSFRFEMTNAPGGGLIVTVEIPVGTPA